MCGEKYHLTHIKFYITGSPPRVRGKAWCADLTAGAPRDHPRVCGEKSICCSMETSLWGSLPRMRGKVRHQRGCRVFAGITPAYAGKRVAAHCSKFMPKDHPRVCGEKSLLLRFQYLRAGSPPRMRGKAEPVFVLCVTSGITPAYAGKSSDALSCNVAVGDHPRVCGEKC